MVQAEPSAVAEIQRRYGDHLYAKHDYDAAVAQYTATIGFLEPSYVIRWGPGHLVRGSLRV